MTGGFLGGESQSTTTAAFDEWIDVTDYGAVGDYVESTGVGTDNYAAFVSAIAAAETRNLPVYVPPGFFLIEYTNNFDDAGTGGSLLIDWPGFRMIGAGRERSKIRMRSVTTSRGRRGSLAGNVITLQTAGDSTSFKVGAKITASPNADGSSPRSVGTFGDNLITAVGIGTVTIQNAAGISGFADGDYLFVDYKFAGLRHKYDATNATTAVYDFVVEGLSITAENTGAEDSSSTANDVATYIYLNQPNGNTTTLRHTVRFADCLLENGYKQIEIQSGPSNANTDITIDLENLEMRGGFIQMYIGSPTGWNKKRINARNVYTHSPMVGSSHLWYVNSSVSIVAVNCEWDGWEISEYAVQHWGGSTVTAGRTHFVNCLFGSSSADGYAVLTNEHGDLEHFTNCTFRGAGGVQMRTNCTFENCLFQLSGSGSGIVTYGDCQYNATLVVDGCMFNLADALGLSQGCIVIDHPITAIIDGCTMTAMDYNQADDSVPLTGNYGAFLITHDSPADGGYVLMRDCSVKQDTGSGNVSYLAQIVGPNRPHVRIERCHYKGRPASDRGAIRLDSSTSATNRVEVENCEITAGAGLCIWADVNIAAGVLSGRGNRFNAVGCTAFATAQRMLVRDGIGPDIASAVTMTWDYDYDRARVTGTAAIDTIQFANGCQIGFDGAVIHLVGNGAWTLTAAGNIAAAATPAAGEMVSLMYDATAAKWRRL